MTFRKLVEDAIQDLRHEDKRFKGAVANMAGCRECPSMGVISTCELPQAGHADLQEFMIRSSGLCRRPVDHHQFRLR